MKNKNKRKFPTFLIIFSIFLTSCNKSFNNKLPMKKLFVNANYENQVTIVFSENLEINGFHLYDKNNPKKVISKLIVGDSLEVYYTTNDYQKIDHILVDTAEYIAVKLTNAIIPGSNGQMGIFPKDDNSKISLIGKHIHYVINRDGSYENINNLDIYQELYGAYKKEDVTFPNESENKEYKNIKLSALYSYDFRR